MRNLGRIGIALSLFVTAIALPITKKQIIDNYTVLQEVIPGRVYHMQSPSKLYTGWSCGYFCLHNAYGLEKLLGYSPASDFQQEVLNFAYANNKNLAGASTNLELVDLADNYLCLHNVYPVKMYDKQVLPIISHMEIEATRSQATTKPSGSSVLSRNEITIKLDVPFHFTQWNINDLAQTHKKEKAELCLKDLRKQVQRSNGILNFICSVKDKSENHWILISVVRPAGEMPCMFVFDNLNRKINASSLTKQYVDQFYALYCA